MQLALIHWLDRPACSRAGYIRAALESGLQNGQGWKHLSNVVFLGNLPANKQFESLTKNYSAKYGIIKKLIQVKNKIWLLLHFSKLMNKS